MGKPIKLSFFIIAFMFLLLPVDMLNGLLLRNSINLPLSLGQLHKLSILLLLLLSFVVKPTKLLLVGSLLLLLLIPSIVQIFIQVKIGFLFKDIIKITRYLTPVFAFLFFVNYIKKGNNIDLLFKLVKFSFIILCGNILLKYIGLGYPMYSFNSVGSKGYFYAGNETSVVLIILSSILGYKVWLEKNIKKYFFIFIFSVFIGVTISSKTGVLGVFVTFLLIPLKLLTHKVSMKNIKLVFYSLFFVMVSFFILLTERVQNSPLLMRTNHFLGKLDFVTFIFSNRNNFVVKALEVYVEKYNFIEKIIGVGQTKYETLNGNSIVEIDIVDIFFAYGAVGLLLFVLLITLLLLQAKRFRTTNNYPYSGFVFLMLIILLGISTIAGHVFSSGMAAVFLGLLFSLMYLKKDTN